MSRVRSFFKSVRLWWVSRKLAKPLFDRGFGIENLLAAGDQKDLALDQLLDLCESDPNVRRVLGHYSAGRPDLKELFGMLQAAGAGQWVGAHYVSASTLAYGQTLDYVLRKLIRSDDPNPDPREVAVRLIQYFERGEVGVIPD